MKKLDKRPSIRLQRETIRNLDAIEVVRGGASDGASGGNSCDGENRSALAHGHCCALN